MERLLGFIFTLVFAIFSYPVYFTESLGDDMKPNASFFRFIPTKKYHIMEYAFSATSTKLITSHVRASKL